MSTPNFEKHRRRFQLAGASSKPKQQVQSVEYPEQEPPREPQEDPDSLHSSSFARLVDAISEGEIEGLCDRNGNVIDSTANMGKAMFLDETPLQTNDGKWNFRGVQVAINYGTPDQSVLQGFGKAADTIYSGQELKHNQPVNIGIVNPEADTIECAVRFNSMLKQDKKTGDIHGSAVRYQVYCSLNGGPFHVLQTIDVKGKCRKPYLKTTSHRLPHSDTPENDSWTIRFLRLTPEPTTLEEANATAVDFITVYTRNRYRYPYTAIVATEISARGFQGIPQRAYRIKGIRVRVPNNYFPETREYNRDPLTGDPVVDGAGNAVPQPWNGGFYVAWTNNPAWVFFDLLTNTRYGLGAQMGVTPTRPDGNVDKWSLYPIAQYCDELVDDGQGGLEPRFACSVYLQAREDAYKVIQDFATVFRGTLFWQGGAISAVQDRPKPVLKDFTNANVIEGVFTYSGTARKARHTVAVVRYSDESNLFKPAFEYVSDPNGLAKFGVREVQVAAFACTSRGQAHRLGKWILNTELNETEMVTFTTGMEGAILRPGDIFRVMDNNRAGVMQGGRLVAVSGDRKSVTLDRDVAIVVGQNTLSMGRPQSFVPPEFVTDSSQVDAMRVPQVVEVVTTTAATAATRVLTFADALPAEVEPGAVWVLKTPNVEPQLFRLINIEEMGPAEYRVTGLRYLPSKFGAVEQGIELEEPDITDLPENPGEVQPPIGVTLQRNPVVTPEGVTLKIVVSWEAPPSPNIDSYTVEKRLGTDNWEVIETTKATHSEFVYTVPGTYSVKVTANSSFGGKSDGIIATLEIPNTNPIELYSITGLELTGQAHSSDFVGMDARFAWRVNSPTVATEPGQEDLSADAGSEDPYFRDFVVEVWSEGPGGLLLYREATVDPFFVFSYSKNSESPGGPHNQFRVEVRGRDRYGNTTKPAALTVQNPPPRKPENLQVQNTWRVAFLSWSNPSDSDLASIEVFVSETPAFADARLVGSVTADAFTHTGLEVGRQYWYWVRAVDTFGNRSTLEPPNGVNITAATLPATDIADFGIDETKIFTEAIVVKGAAWLNHTPTADAIAWNAHKVIFRGQVYEIAEGSTQLAYVWWRGPLIAPDGFTELAPGETAYRFSQAHPRDSGEMTQPNDFIVATNADNRGVYDLAWRGFANAVIGSAYIKSVSANKLTAGTIDGQLIRVGGGGSIQSDNYQAGLTGWSINSGGFAEFNQLLIRENLSVGSGYFNPDFPARVFQARPALVLPITQWNSSWNGGSTGNKNLNTFVCKDGVTRTRRVLLYYGQLTVAPWNDTSKGAANTIASPAVAPLFFGVDRADFAFQHPSVAGATGRLDYFARPRRLGRAGENVFTITAVVKADTWLSVWYQIADAPVWMNGTKMESMGNRYGPNATPYNPGLPWIFAAEATDASATTGYQTMTVTARVAIDVPSDKCILFAIAPMNGTTGRGANSRYNLYNGFFDVTAENVGNILVTTDPGETLPEEPE